MRKEYDFSHARPNPFVRQPPRRPVTIRLGEDTLAYFRELARETALPYQTLINYFLHDCAVNRWRPSMRRPKRK